MSSEQQFREAFPQAIYLHGGRTYEVENVTVGSRDGEVHLKPAEPFLRTRPYLFTVLSVSEIYAGTQWEDFQVYYGRVSATEILQSVQKVDERTGQVLDQWSPQTSGAQNKRADAMWIQLRAIGDQGNDGLEALQHILRVGLQFTIPADLHDVFSHHAKAAHEAYIVESYPGGIGVVKSAYGQWQKVVATGKRIAEECRCRSGCPHCILPARTPDGFDKREGIRLSERMLQTTAIFCIAGLVRVVGRRSDGLERKARVGEAGSVASGVGERSGTRFGLKRDAEVAVRTHRSHRGYRRAKTRGGNQGVAGSRRWRTACSGHRA